MDNFSKLDSTRHMLEWFSDEPYTEIRSTIERNLQEQVDGSRVTRLVVLSEPQWLTGARRSDGDDNKPILVRSGMAFEFAMRVEFPEGAEELAGVYTWVAVDLDKPGEQKQRIWMDLGGTLETFGSENELKLRLYFELTDE